MRLIDIPRTLASSSYLILTLTLLLITPAHA